MTSDQAPSDATSFDNDVVNSADGKQHDGASPHVYLQSGSCVTQLASRASNQLHLGFRGIQT